MVKRNHKLICQNESRIDGHTLSKNTGKLPIAININGHKGNVLTDRKISSNSKNKSSQQTSGSLVTVYHQNIRGLKGKVNELLSQLHPTFPQVFCFSEHHMNQIELQHTFLDGYNLRVCYCRTSHMKGGVCIFVQNDVRCTNIDLGNYCKDKDFEVCAVKYTLAPKGYV